jgi:hypothetical protein
MKMKTLYYKQIQIRSYGYDDFSEGKIILDWINEDEWDGVVPTYEYEYRIFNRFIKL